MLAKRAFGKELTKNMQLWGHNYSTDKAGENAAFVSEAAWDKNRNFMENWSQLHRSLITCPQQSKASFIVVRGTSLLTVARSIPLF